MQWCDNCQLPSTGTTCVQYVATTGNAPAVIAIYHRTAIHLEPSDAARVVHVNTRSHYIAVVSLVNEVNIPTARGAESFDAFLSANGDVITNIVGDYQRR